MKTLFDNIDKTALEPYRIDCSACCGICCVALFCSKSDGFPENKPAGKPCKNLLGDYKCKLHSQLKSNNLKGCITYDCMGAGQKVTKLLGASPDWGKISEADFEQILNAYLKIMQMHQIMWYLEEALHVTSAKPFLGEITQLLSEGTRSLDQPLEILQDFDCTSWRENANRILKDITTRIARQTTGSPVAHFQKNYMGKNLKQKDLRGMDFSMCLLIAANLEQADLYGANFLGADLRDTNIRNTDLSNSLFLTQMQVNSSLGNAATKLPPYIEKPASWNQ